MFALATSAFAAIEVKTEVEVEVGKTMPVPMLTNEKGEVKMNSDGTMMGKSDDDMMEDGMMDDDDDGDEAGDEKGLDRADMMADDHAMFGLETARMHVDVDELLEEESEPGHGGGEAEVDHPSMVHSQADFEHFVAHKAKNDEDIKEVEVKDGKIKVSYRMPAKFLGFMGTSMNVRARADGEGNVDVSYPWYHIFMKKNVSSASLQADIARALAAQRKGVKEGVATTTIEAEVEAAFDAPNLFEIIADILHGASRGAQAKAEAEATAE
ncbi:MAG: hypothetical protein A3C93_04535 [Candidatus Lloydbacteria bacterium RIFCSPHIGHO2_02_FULL_54_17]|uniref:Uncharacterized protein n=1 Tax=Candidatus Lloydbacteria bacterium RIFCSPHIGHO2_02_FULL_54_17 TaxID=1798664 RepID=A0A1G2DGX7_9BACT|nr:MAG: hypothetical protein A3C93_04535 [Candidatus Lloydbacteria bacterium RIFCSPHIGHO2_02_FULL_54_17]OGZ14070.1 MAG: hypothetical protein A2948_06175 [Candidatus Lloydbacteria bacterium RIFCSPLOWO2_01_FULL_54_18]OGZ16584.1 MAG: hypothetical protein A3H76_06540 [Candidatus Lloydbacteria bacterium RIFCSPLOWO2_02_FULL_54_12]